MAIGVVTAAAELGVSPARVRALIVSGAIPATKVGRTYVLDEVVLDRLAQRQRPAHVRAFSPRLAWACAAAADGIRPGWITSSELSRLRHRLDSSRADAGVWQARLASLASERIPLRVAATERDALLGDARVARSGQSVLVQASKKWQEVALPLDTDMTVIWLRTTDELAQLQRKYGMIRAGSGNVIASVAGVDGLPACGDGDGNAYRLVAVADLLSSPDARGRRAGRELLETVLAGRRWSVRPAKRPAAD